MLGRRRSWGGAPGGGISTNKVGYNRRLGPPYVEKVQLVGLAADAVGEEQEIALQPGHLLGRILETNAGARHDGYTIDNVGWWLLG